MPDSAPGRRVERQQAIRKEVFALAVAAPEIERRRTDWQKDDAAPGVYADAAPGVCAAYALPGVFRPCLIAIFAGPGNGMERPANFACAHIVSAYVAGRGEAGAFADARADDQQVFVDCPRRI